MGHKWVWEKREPPKHLLDENRYDLNPELEGDIKTSIHELKGAE